MGTILEKNKRIVGLDFLKIISATIIVMHHYQQCFKLHFESINFYGGLFNFGYFVQMFFIISGFLTLYSTKVGGISELRKKLLRIYPMTTIACIVTLLVKSIRSDNIEALWNIKSLVANFLLLFSGWPFFSMTGYNNPTWYLCILIQCYLVFYIIQWISNRLNVKRLYFDIAVIIGVVLLRRFVLIYDTTYRGVEAFSIGLVVYYLNDKAIVKKWVSFVVLLVSIVFIILFPSQQRWILSYATFPALIIMTINLELQSNERIEDIIHTLGQMSFEVFIWHYPLMAIEKMIIRLTNLNITRHYYSMFIFACIVWLLSFPLFEYVEKPINRFLRKRFS